MALPQLLIFDFDGTLVDTAEDLVRSCNLYLKSKGFEPLPEDRIRSEIGMGLRRLIVDVYPEDNKDEAFKSRIEKEFTEVYAGQFLRTPKLFAGVAEFLEAWEGMIAIVSNKRERFIHPILTQLDLDRFPWVRVIGGDTFPNMKPHPQPLLAAIDAAGVTPEETWIIGDGLPDVEGALAIGSRCVAVEFGYTSIEKLLDFGAWRALADFADLRALLHSNINI